MSQLNVDTIKKADGTGSLTVPAETGTVVTTASPSLGRRNLIINGAMQVFQRGSSVNTHNAFAVDRFQLQLDSTDQLAISLNQDSDAPAGYSYSSKITINTAETAIASDEKALIRTCLEGNTIAHLGWGTSDAEAVNLSFWVKSSATGTYSAVLVWGSSGANQRSYTGQYTINTANTWERKTISVPADTDGTYSLETGTGRGIQIRWTFGAGSAETTGTANAWASVNTSGASTDDEFITTANATWQITGVQLEVGSVATPFEHRSYGEELALCQRYFFRSQGTEAYTAHGLGANFDGDTSDLFIHYPVPMRARPDITFSGTVSFHRGAGTNTNVTNMGDAGGSTTCSFIRCDHGNVFTTGDAVYCINNNDASGEISFNAEL